MGLSANSTHLPTVEECATCKYKNKCRSGELCKDDKVRQPLKSGVRYIYWDDRGWWFIRYKVTDGVYKFGGNYKNLESAKSALAVLQAKIPTA